MYKCMKIFEGTIQKGVRVAASGTAGKDPVVVVAGRWWINGTSGQETGEKLWACHVCGHSILQTVG